MINAKYAHPDIGRRNLETIVAATLEATLLTRDEAPPQAFLAAAAALSAASRAAYRALVYETDGFADYFFAATPIAEIAQLNIGSRPARGRPTGGSRTSVRSPGASLLGPEPHCAPGLVRLRRGRGDTLLAAGDRDASLDLRALPDGARLALLPRDPVNMDMVLAKADIGLGRRYADLVPDRRLRRASSPSSRPNGAGRSRARSDHGGDHAARRQSVARPLDHAPLRLAYIAPLNHLQVELLRRWRAGETDDKARPRDPDLDQPSRAGLRNTG